MNLLDLQVKVWRRDLHKWDPEIAEDEEVIEVGLDIVHSGQTCCMTCTALSLRSKLCSAF